MEVILDRAAIQPEVKRCRCNYLNGKSSAIAVLLKYGFLAFPNLNAARPYGN
ncbi:hypothetical protein [Gloeocapsa sp. PCC 7428]|uniref:hypothetical protein n=1 Tax=Gloeocapsa sp. PCC 7428 TaxID=1173026 RepID=UPI0018C8C7CE|nr:hypothetical protein [Gloeocapsa sp. PCC 7428]